MSARCVERGGKTGRRAVLKAGLAAAAVLLLGRVLPRNWRQGAAAPPHDPPGREARWWRKA